jgi:hypothetical protein
VNFLQAALQQGKTSRQFKAAEFPFAVIPKKGAISLVSLGTAMK